MKLWNRLPGVDQPVAPIRNRLIRVLVVAGLAGLSGSLFYSHLTFQVGVLPFWLFAGLLYSSFVGVSAAVIFTVLPRLAEFVELTAISRFGIAIAATQDPSIATTLTASPFLNANLIIGTAIFLRYALRARPWLQSRTQALLARLGEQLTVTSQTVPRH